LEWYYLSESYLGKYNLIDLEKNISVNKHTIPYDYGQTIPKRKNSKPPKQTHKNIQPNQRGSNDKKEDSKEHKTFELNTDNIKTQISTSIVQYKALEFKAANQESDKKKTYKQIINTLESQLKELKTNDYGFEGTKPTGKIIEHQKVAIYVNFRTT